MQENSEQSYFLTRYTFHPARDQVWAHITRFLEPFWKLPQEASVMELGTGYGSWIRAVPAKRRVALDTNPHMERTFRERGIVGVEPFVGSCTDLTHFESESFDLVLASNLLEHLVYEDVQRTLLEVRRVLKPGGRLCLIQPNFRLCAESYFDDFTHRTIFTDTSLNDFVASEGFKTVRLWRRFLPLTMKSSAGHLTFFVPLYLRSPIKPLAGQMCLISQKI